MVSETSFGVFLQLSESLRNQYLILCHILTNTGFWYIFRIIKLSEWAKRIGISYKTAWRMYEKGMVKNAMRLLAERVIVLEEERGDYTAAIELISGLRYSHALIGMICIFLGILIPSSINFWAIFS
jgi:hypothetical protein